MGWDPTCSIVAASPIMRFNEEPVVRQEWPWPGGMG